MKIYFVRHGQTQKNKERRATGWADDPLNEEGIKEAYKTKEEVPNDFTHIYSSDLVRCRQTAEIINKKLNILTTYDIRLRERNFGSLQGKTIEEIGSELWEKDHNQEYNYQSYGGESVKDVKERLFDFIFDIKKKQNGKKVLIVTHAGIIRLLHHLLKGKIPEKIYNASVHEFDFPDTF